MRPLVILSAALFALVPLLLLAPGTAYPSEETESCFDCHDDPDETREDGTSVDNGAFERWYDNGAKEYEAVFSDGKKAFVDLVAAVKES